MKVALLLGFIALLLGCSERELSRKEIADEIEQSLRNETLAKWYPAALDTAYGGFLSTFTYDFKPTGNQDKMIVTQARHTWSNATAFKMYPQETQYLANARHGFNFLRDVMWDSTAGGFYQLVTRHGEVKDTMKTAYGNAFGIYALSAYYSVSRDSAALQLAQKAFAWLEQGSHDSNHKGYFQHLTRRGQPITRSAETPSTSDLGYKDQNSSIHLLEAFTELYAVWPDSLVRARLQEMLELIRDVIVNEKGSLTLFLKSDFTPVSFHYLAKDSIMKYKHLDHVSFGHDIETAYLLLEASHILGLENDEKTERIAKKMTDHTLTYGWDQTVGGFFDEGYYFNDEQSLTILRDTKNWWAQAEGMNTLLLMADRYPHDPMNYYEKFKTQWKYCNTYLIDHQYGDWFAGGTDKEPEVKTALKGHIWKGNYHQLRSMINCTLRLRNTKIKEM